jgi:hypothetical protein
MRFIGFGLWLGQFNNPTPAKYRLADCNSSEA